MASHLLKFLKQNIVSYLLITATLLTSGLIVNIIQVLLHVFVKPFNKRLFHHCMYYVSWTWLSRKYWQAEIAAIRILHARIWVMRKWRQSENCFFFWHFSVRSNTIIDGSSPKDNFHNWSTTNSLDVTYDSQKTHALQ
jgi:hypothetical protein